MLGTSTCVAPSARSAGSCADSGGRGSRCGVGQACWDDCSAEIAAGPAAHAVCGTLGEAAVACQAVFHMDCQFGVPAAHRADRNVIARTTPQVAVELTVDERVEVAAVAEMIEVHHAAGNPTSTQMLPAE